MNNKDWTPEELELKEALNKLYESDTREPTRPLDLSFMEAPEKQSFFKRHPRLVNVAAIVAIVFVTAFITANVVANDYVSAAKEQVQRKVFEMKHSIVVVTDEEFAEEGETVWEITDFEVAKKAKELVPELPIPGYVPEGYEFEKLVIHLLDNGKHTANFLFYNENYSLNLNTNVVESNDLSGMNFNGETFTIKGREIALWSDSIALSKGITTISDYNLIQVTSSDYSLSDKELIAIIQNIDI